MRSTDVITAHERQGRRLTAGGVDSFVLDRGAGTPASACTAYGPRRFCTARPSLSWPGGGPAVADRIAAFVEGS
ncbi:MAG: hypothetical protein ACR2F6_00485 [Mycobacteriales bacterium]